MTKKKIKTVTEYLYMLNLIFYVIVAVPLVIFLVMYLGNHDQLKELGFISVENMLLKSVMVIFAFMLIAMAELRFYRKLRLDHAFDSFLEKLEQYYYWSVTRYFMYGLAALISCLGFYFFKEGLFIGLYMIALFTLTLIRPTKRGLKRSKLFAEEEIAIIMEVDVIS